MNKLLLASMIVCVSNSVIAAIPKTSTTAIKDTYKVNSTCLLEIDGSKDTKEKFGDTFTAKLTTNVKQAGRKIAFVVSDESDELGDVTVVSPTNDSVIYTNNVDASAKSGVDFKMKSTTVDAGTLITAGDYQATVTVTATCTI